MTDPSTPDPTRAGSGPFGPAPVSPPVRTDAVPYADPFATAAAPPPTGGGNRGRHGVWVALAAVLGAAAAIAVIAWYLSIDDETAQLSDPPTANAAPTAPPTTDVPATDGPSTEGGSGDDSDAEAGAVVGAACPDGTRPEICDAAQFIEEVRGRSFKEFPVVEFADDGEFQERLLADVDAESIAETEVQGDVLGSLGLVPSGTDLVDVTTKSLEVGVVGFYDPTTAELVVRGSDIDLFVELVIVHELVHAHDDQWFDLDRPELEDADDERYTGFVAVLEGNASRVEQIWRDRLDADEQSELAMLEATFYGPDEIAILQQIPRFVLESQFFPYRDGPVLVEAIAASAGGGMAGERAVDDALVDPPVTSEQALHPEQYLAAEPAPTAPAPRPAGPVVDEGVVGELVFDLWFGDRVGDGWNGDRYVSFESEGRICTVINVAADSDDDLDEIFDAAADWVGEAEEGDRRRSDQSNVEGVDVIVIEGCR